MPRLDIDLSMRLAKFQDSLSQIERSTGKTAARMKSAFRGVGAVIGTAVGILATAGIARSITNITKAADELSKAGRKVGVTTEALSELKFAADLSGVSFEQLQKGLIRLAANMGDVQKGTGEAKDAFKDLGINVETSGGQLKKGDAVLAEIAEKFAGMEDGATKTAIAVKLFGKAGADLIPLLNLGSQGIGELRMEAERLGITFSTEVGEAAEQFNDDMTRIQRSIDGIRTQIVVGMLPALNDLAAAFVSSATDVEGWREIGKDVGDTLREIAVIATNVTGVIKILGSAFSGVVESVELATDGAFKSIPAVFARIRTERDKIVEETAQRISVLRGEGPASFGPPVPRRERTAGPRLTSSTGGGASKAASDAKAAAAAELALVRSRGQAAIAEQRALVQERLEILRRFYDKGLIAEGDYWQTRQEITKDGSAAIVAVLNKEVEERQKAVAKAAPNSADYFKAVQDLEGALEKRNEAERQFGRDSQKAYFEAQDAAEAYGNEVERISAQILELRGNTQAAVALQTELEQRAIRTKATARGDTATINNLVEIKLAREAQAAFNKERERGQEIIRDLAIEEERIQNSRRVGAIGELSAFEKTGEARKAAAEQLKAIGAELQFIAINSGLPELSRQSKEFAVELEKLAASADLLGESLNSIVQSSAAQAFDDFISGSKSASEAMNDFGRSVVNQVNKLVAEELSKKLFSAVFGGLGAGGGAGGIGGLISGLISGGGGGAAAGFGGFAGSAADLSLLNFQHGGSFDVGGSGGPDSQVVAFRATPGEKVQINPPGQSSGGNVININVNVPAGTSGNSAQQIAFEAGRAVERSVRRNG